MKLLNNIIKSTLLSVRAKEYISYEKISFFNRKRVVNEIVKKDISDNIEKNIDDFRKVAIVISMFSTLIFTFVVLPFFMFLITSLKDFVIVEKNYETVHPILIMNCVYDDECNEPIKDLNIHNSKDVYAINSRALTYYRNFIKNNPNYNIEESSYNKLMLKKYIKDEN